jgi:TPR repeat protein
MAVAIYPKPRLMSQLGLEEAARFYRKAADLGNGVAANNLGRLYRYGIGVIAEADRLDRVGV